MDKDNILEMDRIKELSPNVLAAYSST